MNLANFKAQFLLLIVLIVLANVPILFSLNHAQKSLMSKMTDLRGIDLY